MSHVPGQWLRVAALTVITAGVVLTTAPAAAQAHRSTPSDYHNVAVPASAVSAGDQTANSPVNVPFEVKPADYYDI